MEYASQDKYRNEYLTAMGRPPYGDILARIAAFIIDILILFVIFMIFWLTLGTIIDSVLREILQNWFVVYVIVFVWIYETAFLVSPLQATPGKIAVGLKVVDMSGRRLSPSKAFFRTFIKYLYFIPGLMGPDIASPLMLLIAILDGMFIFAGEKRQALHDMVVKTVVIYDDREKQF